jgi:hypothetical protein
VLLRCAVVRGLSSWSLVIAAKGPAVLVELGVVEQRYQAVRCLTALR